MDGGVDSTLAAAVTVSNTACHRTGGLLGSLLPMRPGLAGRATTSLDGSQIVSGTVGIAWAPQG